MHCTASEVQTVVVCCRPIIFTPVQVYQLRQQACRCCLQCVAAAAAAAAVGLCTCCHESMMIQTPASCVQQRKAPHARFLQVIANSVVGASRNFLKACNCPLSAHSLQREEHPKRSQQSPSALRCSPAEILQQCVQIAILRTSGIVCCICGSHSAMQSCEIVLARYVTLQGVACLNAASSAHRLSYLQALQSNMQASAPMHIPAPDMYAPQAPQPVQVVVVGLNTQTAAVDMNTNIKCCQKPAGRECWHCVA
jgi:hypothetical protein